MDRQISGSSDIPRETGGRRSGTAVQWKRLGTNCSQAFLGLPRLAFLECAVRN